MAPVRIALLQYDPKFGHVKDNIAKVDAMLAGVTPASIDILLLPEMAFTGYMMKGIEEAQRYLEVPSEEDEWDTVIWAKRTSKRLRCYTLVGFPERDPMHCMAYNSLLVVDTTGEIQVGCLNPFNKALSDGSMQDVYKKHFLYETDKTWALPGRGFITMEFDLPGRPEPLIVAPAICMDLVRLLMLMLSYG
jgi:protein N-terminal amidase